VALFIVSFVSKEMALVLWGATVAITSFKYQDWCGKAARTLVRRIEETEFTFSKEGSYLVSESPYRKIYSNTSVLRIYNKERQTEEVTLVAPQLIHHLLARKRRCAQSSQ
jgi:hypothetical protein